MSDHADTIRHALEALDRDSQFLDGREYSPAELAENLGALDALVAENSRLNVSEADWCSQALEAQAENQRLRDALERSDRALRLLLARKPLRDAAETLAETSAALERWSK